MVAMRRRDFGMALALSVLAGAAAAQPYPSKPIKLVLGYPTGAGADAVARAAIPAMERELKGTIVVEYKPGAGGVIAASFVAKAPADGYTLFLTDNGPLTTSPHLRPLDYDPLKAFAPISMAVAGGSILVAHPSVPAKTLAELFAHAKANPGLRYGTSSLGGGAHLAAEMLSASLGLGLVHVPYRGGAQAITDLVGGHIPLLMSSLPAAVPFIKDGRIRAYGVTSLARAPILPDVPTLHEQGVTGFEALVWFGLVAPAGTPAPIVAQINAAFVKAAGEEPFQRMAFGIGYSAVPGSPDAFAARIGAEHAKWGRVIREAKIKID
jgi:tripartite-type tricarboxylate transporter receptor subunit TctC